jgi:hypothetical protein
VPACGAPHDAPRRRPPGHRVGPAAHVVRLALGMRHRRRGARAVTAACCICERPIVNAPPNAPPLLCPWCASHPLLLAAFRAGLDRVRDDKAAP